MQEAMSRYSSIARTLATSSLGKELEVAISWSFNIVIHMMSGGEVSFGRLCRARARAWDAQRSTEIAGGSVYYVNTKPFYSSTSFATASKPSLRFLAYRYTQTSLMVAVQMLGCTISPAKQAAFRPSYIDKPPGDASNPPFLSFCADG